MTVVKLSRMSRSELPCGSRAMHQSTTHLEYDYGTTMSVAALQVPMSCWHDPMHF